MQDRLGRWPNAPVVVEGREPTGMWRADEHERGSRRMGAPFATTHLAPPHLSWNPAASDRKRLQARRTFTIITSSWPSPILVALLVVVEVLAVLVVLVAVVLLVLVLLYC